ncbi:alpha/beta-hydrolase [Hypoxylon sp. FL1284]|nr:alpha/beta-hydrolase [Hypoxylon sp. FL1284]
MSTLGQLQLQLPLRLGDPEQPITEHDTTRPPPDRWVMGHEPFRMSHHGDIGLLWETRWRDGCSRAVYPFHDGNIEDFRDIFDSLILNKIHDPTSPRYTSSFVLNATNLERRGDEALARGDRQEASALYLRAACVMRIARFPYITKYPRRSCEHKWKMWERQKAVYMKAGRTWEPSPLQEVMIDHRSARGLDYDVIPAYVRVPPRGGAACPAVILLTGLDGYRTDNTQRCNEILSRGWAVVVFEIPGTADSPAAPTDAASGDRLMTSVMEWMRADGRFDMQRVMCWGLSCGGYYAVRAAHTHHEKLRGVVAHGAGVHHWFSASWLSHVDGHEYPFALTPALACKFGYGTDVEDFIWNSQPKWSLLDNGILDTPCTRLLLVNGMDDGLMPIEDSMLLLEYGRPKEARFFTGRQHMGYPEANSAVYPWMERVMGSDK